MNCNLCQKLIRGRAKHAKYCSDRCRQLRYTRANKQAQTEKSKQWRKKNSEWVRAYDREFNRRKRATVLDHYGNVCACCGEDTPEFLTIDHINNDGAEHRRQGVTSIYRWLVKSNFPEGFQLLCWNCNAAKQWNDGCPHQTNINRAAVVAQIGAI